MNLISLALKSEHFKILVSFYIIVICLYVILSYKAPSLGSSCSSCKKNIGSSNSINEPTPVYNKPQVVPTELSSAAKTNPTPAPAAAKAPLQAVKDSVSQNASSSGLQPYTQLCDSEFDKYPFPDANLKQKFNETERAAGPVKKPVSSGKPPIPFNDCRPGDIKYNVGQATPNN